MSHTRRASPGLGPTGRKTERTQTRTRHQARTQAPTRTRYIEELDQYAPQVIPTQGDPDYYGDTQYTEQNSEWAQYPSSQRQPSAHLSEIESTDETYMNSQNKYQNEEAEMEYDMAPDNRLIPAPKGSYTGDGLNRDGVRVEYEEISVIESRHPSDARIRHAREMSQRSKNREPVVIGKTGPQPFQPTKPSRTRAQVDYEQSEARSTQYSTEDEGQLYDPPRRGFTAPGNTKTFYRPSKLNQSTKFDTPSEKGSRSHSNARVGNTRSSDSGQRERHRRGPESDIVHVDYTPTATSKSTRHRSRIDIESQGPTFAIDDGFDTSASHLAGILDDRFDSSPLKVNDAIVFTPPSDRTLAMGQDRHAKAAKSKITISDDILDSDVFSGNMDMEGLETGVDDVIAPGTHLKLKMPKTVDQVVKHITNVLAKKVAKDQGDIAIKSFESWDWSRLSVLSSEMNAGFKEMEDQIKGAGQNRQGDIENTKRKRVDMEKEVTGQYEEFRGDFREACQMMQQPAKLGKKFKFGPF